MPTGDFDGITSGEIFISELWGDQVLREREERATLANRIFTPNARQSQIQNALERIEELSGVRDAAQATLQRNLFEQASQRLHHERNALRQMGLNPQEISQWQRDFRELQGRHPFQPIPVNDLSQLQSTTATEVGILDQQAIRDAITALNRANVPEAERTASFHRSLLDAIQQATGATDHELAKAEDKLIGDTLMQEMASRVGIAFAEGMDARIYEAILEKYACKKCQDGWIEVDREKGEYELCECAAEGEPAGVDRDSDSVGAGHGGVLAGRQVPA